MIINSAKLKFLFFLCLIQIQANCFSQQNKYNFRFNDKPLVDVINEISSSSGTNILYNPSIIPDNIRINGIYTRLTIQQALDTIFRNTQIAYKFYKNDIVLYKKAQQISETHTYNKLNTPKITTANKYHETVIDTATYSVITFDTVTSRLTEIVKIPFIDTIKFTDTIQYHDTIRFIDTVKVFQKVYQQVKMYRPLNKAYGIGISASQGIFSSSIRFSDSFKDTSGVIKKALKERNSSAFGFNFMYRTRSWQIETGISLTKLRYKFDYTTLAKEMVSRIDTIDKYYTDVVDGDTAWVYITEEKQVESSVKTNYLSDLTYQYISIPLLVGYSFVNNNFTFEIKAGIVGNYYIGSKGSYLTLLKDNTFQVEKKKAPGTDFIFDVFGAVCIDYYLNEKVHIFTQPFVSYTSLSLGKSNTSYYPGFFQSGIQLGFRYFFKK